MRSKLLRSGLTFRASPCEVTHREAETPMAATLARPPSALLVYMLVYIGGGEEMEMR